MSEPSLAERIEGVVARLPAVPALAMIEHLFGVLPLVGACFAPELQEIANHRTGALGLFTPTPEMRWGAAVDGEPAGGGLLLRGEVRLAHPEADGALLLVRLAGGEQRLAWLAHGTAGVERRGSRQGGAVESGAPCWLALDGALVGPDLLSRPLGDLDLVRALAAYAGVWALAAVLLAGEGVRALRRAARTTAYRGTAFNSSQLVAFGITEVEIETELTALAVRGDLALAPDDPARSGGLALAAAAARALAAVLAKQSELCDRMGLTIDGPFAGGGARALAAFLGGPLMLESELGYALEATG